VEVAVVNGCECKSPATTVIEFSNFFPDGTNASVCSGIMVQNNDIQYNK
jgi:hypothetical protein